jgi:hypothetical protein
MPATETAWQPANDTQRRLLEALSTGDVRGYFTILCDAQLYLPGFLADGPEATSQKLVTMVRGGLTYLPVFTAVESLAAFVHEVAEAVRTTTVADLARSWPDPAWRLAVDPNLPIGVVSPIDDVTRAAEGDLAVPLLPPGPDGERFEPASQVEYVMWLAKSAARPAVYLDALVVAGVLVPVDSERSWRVAADEDGPVITAFTSAQRLAEAIPDGVSTRSVDFLTLARDWPGSGVRLAVNPATPIDAWFTGTQVAELVQWARALAAAAVDSPTPLVELPLSPDDVDRYLRDGCDRATGRVRAPRGAPGPVLRWPAHVPELYRRTRRTAADESIVDSVLLPHGAVIADGPTTVASYDADQRRWLPAGRPGPSPPTVRDGYLARWRGADYEASPDGFLIRLYTAGPTPGFDPVAAGRYRRLIPAEEAEWHGYVRTTAVWREVPVIVLDGKADMVLIAVEAQPAPPGFHPAEPGVHHGWVHQLEVERLRRSLYFTGDRGR